MDDKWQIFSTWRIRHTDTIPGAYIWINFTEEFNITYVKMMTDVYYEYKIKVVQLELENGYIQNVRKTDFYVLIDDCT